MYWLLFLLAWWLYKKYYNPRLSMVPIGVQKLDLAKYIGTWYEIITTPWVHDTIEYGCSCAQAYYSKHENAQGTIDVINTCQRHNIPSQVRGKAERISEAQFKVSFKGIPSINTTDPNYIILKLWEDGGNYKIALVGSNTRRAWWLLARDPNFNDNNIVQEAMVTLQQLGYDTTKSNSRCTPPPPHQVKF